MQAGQYTQMRLNLGDMAHIRWYGVVSDLSRSPMAAPYPQPQVGSPILRQQLHQ
jgi:hypothetical protein